MKQHHETEEKMSTTNENNEAASSPGTDYDRGTLVVAALTDKGLPLPLASRVVGETAEEIAADVAELAEAWQRMRERDSEQRRPSPFAGIQETAGTRRPASVEPPRSAAAMYGNQPIAVRAGEPEPPRFNPADYQ